jgi:HlyD family secretion protein
MKLNFRKLTKRKKYLLAGAGVILLVIIIVGGRKRGVEVKIETVDTHDLVSSVTASGQIQPHTKVDISADITGRITRLAVQEGDSVTQGQFLLEIDPSQYKADVQRAIATVASNRAQEAQAQANYKQAQSNYERVAELKHRNPALVSNEQVEQLHTQVIVNQALLETAKHNVAEAQAALRNAQSSLSKTTIVAPISGRVTRLNVEQGETAIMGTLNKDAATLLTISDMSALETKVKVDETDVSHIKVGDSAIVQIDAFPDTTFRGYVTDISNSSVQNTAASGDQAVDYEVTVRLRDVPRQTRPDFSTQAKIITATRKQALAIPIIALTVRENTPLNNEDSALALGRSPVRPVGERDVEGVFVVGSGNKVTFRPVKVGITGEKYFEVLSGLRRGEHIVAGPYTAIRELKDGVPVHQMKSEDTHTDSGKP